MTASVLCVPQWQGSGSREARRLAEGARATAALLSGARRSDTLVLETGSPKRDGVHNLDALVTNLARTREALAALSEAPGLVLTAGGDCGVELAPIGAAAERYGDALTVLWLDAHADANTPASSPSGSFHGMVLRTLLGEGPRELVPARPLRPTQVVLAGTRAFDPAELELVRSAGIRHVSVAEMGALRSLGGPLYVHLDLDVLDPEAFGAISCPEAGGVRPSTLMEALALLEDVIAVGIVEHSPNPATATADAAILRGLLAALRAF